MEFVTEKCTTLVIKIGKASEQVGKKENSKNEEILEGDTIKQKWLQKTKRVPQK